MPDSRLDRGIGSAFSLLLALCAVMVVVGFVLPGSKADARPDGFHSMAAPAVPTRLVVPALHIRAPILPIEVQQNGVLDPPRNPRDVGWWKRSARAGATRGQTVLTGHTVHTGGGVMDALGKLKSGQVVRVVTPRGAMVYRTTRVVTWSKAELAKRARDIFAQGREKNRLVLITCTGWTGHDYTSNVVAFAQPLGVRDS